MSYDEFDLKKSKEIGQLYPVLVDAHGNIIDGEHRLEEDPNWRKEKLDYIDTEEKLLVAKCAANWNRRQLSLQEKAELINGLAGIYRKQGCKVPTRKHSGKNEIKAKIMETTGCSQPTVNKFIDEKYKAYTSKERKRKPKIPASERIANKLGEDVLKRHEEEVKKKIERDLRKSTKKVNKNPLNDEIQQLKTSSQPNFLTMFVAKGEGVMDHICKPLERFKKIDVSALNDLDDEKKGEVLAVLLESQKKIAEWIEAIEGHAK